VIRNNDDSGEFLLSQKGITQGDPIAMLGYAIGMMPLISPLKAEFPELEQPWYAGDSEAAAEFTRIRPLFERFLELGPG
jgi:hypothetical protein